MFESFFQLALIRFIMGTVGLALGIIFVPAVGFAAKRMIENPNTGTIFAFSVTVVFLYVSWTAWYRNWFDPRGERKARKVYNLEMVRIEKEEKKRELIEKIEALKARERYRQALGIRSGPEIPFYAPGTGKKGKY